MEGKEKFTEDDIQKAINELELLTKKTAPAATEGKDALEKSTGDDLSKIDDQIAELQKKKEELTKGGSDDLNKNQADSETIIKSVVEQLGPKFESVVTIAKSIDQKNEILQKENEELKGQNDELKKSFGDMSEKLEKALGTLEEMANSPFGQLKSFKKANAVEKFTQQKTEDGKLTKSLSANKRELVNEITKAVESSDNPEALASDMLQVVSTIENGYVADHNFEYIKKSVENTLGGKYNIVG